MSKKVIYNVILGGYDTLQTPTVITPGWDYVCFTDDKDLKSDIWDIRVIKKDRDLTNAKMSKKVMILYYEYVNEYDISICVPGYSSIQVNLDDFVRWEYKKNKDMAILNHPRHCPVFKEVEMHLKKGYLKDPYGVLREQIKQYRKEGLPEDSRSYPSGIMIREKGNKNLEKHCKLWWDEIYKHSHRDQISLAYVLWKYELIKTDVIGFRKFNKFFQNEVHHNYIDCEIR